MRAVKRVGTEDLDAGTDPYRRQQVWKLAIQHSRSGVATNTDVKIERRDAMHAEKTSQ